MGKGQHRLSRVHRRTRGYDVAMLDSLRQAAQWAATPAQAQAMHAGDIRTLSIGACEEVCCPEYCACAGTGGAQHTQGTGHGTYGPSTGDTARDVVAWYAQPPAPCTCHTQGRARCTAWHADTTRTVCAHTTHDHAGTCGPQCNGTPCTCTQVKGTGRPLWLPQGT